MVKILNSVEVASNPNEYVRKRTEILDYETVNTVPDQSMTLREIVDRFSMGISVDAEHPTYYQGTIDEVDESFIDPTKDPAFDLSDYTSISQSIISRQREAEAKATAGLGNNQSTTIIIEDDAKKGAQSANSGQVTQE